MNLRKQAVSGIKWTSISSLIALVFSTAQIAIVARLLSPGDFGIMAIILAVGGFAQAFIDMGISNALIHYQHEDRRRLSSLYWLNIFAGLMIFLVINAIRPLISVFYHEPSLNHFLFLFSFIFVIISVGQQSQALLERDLKFKQVAFSSIFASISGFVMAVFLAYAGYGVRALVFGQLANATVRTISITAMGFRRWRPMFHFRRSDLKGYVSFGLYQMGERMANYFGANMDKLLIGYLLGVGELGYYSVAYQVMTKPFSVFNPVITRVAFPLFSKIQENNDRLRRGFLDVTRVIALVLFPVYIGLIVFAKPFFLLVVGPKWLPAVPVFQILAVWGLFIAIGNPIGSLLLAKGRADWGFYLNIVMLPLTAIFIWLGSRFGINGVAAGMVIARAFVSFLVCFWVRWALVEMRPREYINSFMPALVSALSIGLMVHFVDALWPGSCFIPKLCLLPMAGLLFYAFFVFAFQKGIIMEFWQDFKKEDA